jgi:uncharacterized membrane protein HdeD (DUF308 family)
MMSTLATGLANILSRTWWALLLRGVVGIVFGVYAFTHPGLSLNTLTLVFGAYVLIDGVGGVVSAISGRGESEHWVVLLLWSLISVAVGLATLFVPTVTTLVLLFYIAIWANTTGVLQIVSAIRVRKEIEGEWRLIAGGLVSVAVGLVMLTRPAVGALAFIWLIGAYAFVFGVLLVILAFKVRAVKNRIEERIPQPAV